MENIFETLSQEQRDQLSFFRSVVEFFKEENSSGLSSYLSTFEAPDIREDVSTLGLNQTCSLILESIQILYEEKGEQGLIEAGQRWEDYVTDGATWEDFLEFVENRSLERTTCNCDNYCDYAVNPNEVCYTQCGCGTGVIILGETEQESGSTFGQWLANLGGTIIDILPTIADAVFATPDNNYQYTPYNPQQQGGSNQNNQSNLGNIILYSVLGIGVIVGIILLTRKK
jgi:hypothetical protein